MAEDKKQLLIEKASQLFLKNGYQKTSMRDLAKAVNIQAPGLYYYFKSKKEILYEINEQSWRIFQESILDKVIKVHDPEEKIKIYIRNMIKYQLSILPITFIVDDSISTKHIKARKAKDAEVFHLLRDILRELAEIKGTQNTIDPTLAAFSLYNIVARIYKWYNPKGRISLEELTDQITRLFLHGFYGEKVGFGEGIEMKKTWEGHPIMDGIMVLPPSSKVPYLLAGRCSKCGRTFFPKKEICPDCFNLSTVEEIALSPKGKLASFSIVRRSLGPKKTPYALGYIDTPEQVRFLAPLTDCDFDELRIGMDMEVVFEEESGDDGSQIVIYKYRPVKWYQSSGI